MGLRHAFPKLKDPAASVAVQPTANLALIQGCASFFNPDSPAWQIALELRPLLVDSQSKF
jgi:hypothetical protein